MTPHYWQRLPLAMCGPWSRCLFPMVLPIKTSGCLQLSTSLLTCHSLAFLSFIRVLVCAGQLGYPGIRSWQPRASWCSVDAINGDCCDSVHPSGGHLVVCRGHSRCTAPEPSDRKAGRPLRASAVALHDPLHTLLGPHQVAAGTGEWGAVWVWCGL